MRGTSGFSRMPCVRWSHAWTPGNRRSNSSAFNITRVAGDSRATVMFLKYSKRSNLASEYVNMDAIDDAGMSAKVRHQGDSDKIERKIPHFFSRVSAESLRMPGWAVTATKACTATPSSVRNNTMWQTGLHPGVGALTEITPISKPHAGEGSSARNQLQR